MNRRRFSGAMLGAGSLLVAGFTLQSTAAFAKTTDEEKPEGDLSAHITDSRRRIYEHARSGDFVVAIVIAMDKKRYASDMFDNLVATGVSTFGDFTIDDEGEYGDLTDQGYRYTGVITEEPTDTNVAVIYVQQGKIAYAIAAGSEDDPTDLLDEYYETLFDEAREESDTLLTEDEMPRGFEMTADDANYLGEPSDDESDEEKDGGRKGRTSRMLVAACGGSLRAPSHMA
ncbi:MAG: hypothetical protein QM753_03125 [Thermomicrobiales bacterium]